MKKNSIFTVALGVYILFSVHNTIAFRSSISETDTWLHTDTWLQGSSSGTLRGAIGTTEEPEGKTTVGTPIGQLPVIGLLLASTFYCVLLRKNKVRDEK
jgi:hypothetical protein